MNKKLFLHIGLPKTGTTALQSFFASKAEILAERGIAYPLPSKNLQHHSFLAVPGREDSPPVLEAWKRIQNELSLKNWKTLILSSERFFLCDPEKVYTECRKFCDQAVVVLYLRNKTPLLLSCYRTAIKSEPRVCCDADTFIPFFFNNHTQLDYDTLIARWTSVFGRDNVEIVSYEKACRNSNTIESFLDLLTERGVNFPEMSFRETQFRTNITEPDIVFDLLLRTNRFYYGDFPYWETIIRLFKISEEVGLDHDLTTCAMIPGEKGLDILKNDEKSWNMALKPHLSETESDSACETSLQKKQIVTDAERIEKQISLLERLPEKDKTKLQDITNVPLVKIPEIPVVNNDAEHYAVLYKRNYEIIKEFRDNDIIRLCIT